MRVRFWPVSLQAFKGLPRALQPLTLTLNDLDLELLCLVPPWRACSPPTPSPEPDPNPATPRPTLQGTLAGWWPWGQNLRPHRCLGLGREAGASAFDGEHTLYDLIRGLKPVAALNEQSPPASAQTWRTQSPFRSLMAEPVLSHFDCEKPVPHPGGARQPLPGPTGALYHLELRRLRGAAPCDQEAAGRGGDQKCVSHTFCGGRQTVEVARTQA